MKINPDGTLSIEAMSVSVDELEQLIRDLALHRARMSPQVPMKLPSGDEKVVVHQVVAAACRRNADGSANLMIRNPGLGWLYFQLNHITAVALAKRLADVEVLRADGQDIDSPDKPKH